MIPTQLANLRVGLLGRFAVHCTGLLLTRFTSNE